MAEMGPTRHRPQFITRDFLTELSWDREKEVLSTLNTVRPQKAGRSTEFGITRPRFTS